MTVLDLVVVAAVFLIWMVVHSYAGGDDGGTRPMRAAQRSDGRDAWMFSASDGGGDTSGGDCSGGDGGGGCGGDGGGDGGADGD
jgi:hypothetical protein